MQCIIGNKFGKWTVLAKSEMRGRWACRCECGTERLLTRTALTRKESVQCSRCYYSRLRPGVSACNAVLNDYRQQAKRRDLEWALTNEEAESLFESTCRFCGCPPSQKKKIKSGNGFYWFNGIDRRDNSIGYIASNCVTCCWMCNWMKRDLTTEEFLEHIERIHANQQLQHSI